MTSHIYDLDLAGLAEMMESFNQPSYRAHQIWQGLYHNLWGDLKEFSVLPRSLRERLAEEIHLAGLKEEKSLLSNDGQTRKTLYRLRDGSAIETVLMAYTRGNTVCVSSQVGCAMGCAFCATGDMGFSRNLTSGEIIEQIIKTAAALANEGQRLTNVVFMGMGEPMHNYQAVKDAIYRLNDPEGFGFGQRRFTVSTVGLVPGIRDFGEEDWQVNLAISLHAAEDELRSRIVPVNKKYPISALIQACDQAIEKTGRRISVEWALIEGINDSPEQARSLVDLLAGKLYHVNLIRLNPVKHFQGKPSTDNRASQFQQIVAAAGIPCTIRLRRGIDIQAGCGQLASESARS